ncbi:maleylpyruvate isomerase family mycothiol-dependent enzyme [Nocardioides sp. YIM 152315]|uniref:maleylpyruvate isomerase family mycothiol-dependent enzyme n=1 Tax=Nocardioides sp. YIM 152315 TaxID=3031760 RepID=UPI0023DC1776|nr:maleylpyruvate isomerase family mycothiol-dependent enzyme [Nocardioides sp. YIM 152315]MDF1602676.1 maleylpyruvate isomerase family mycothiol-dependent enzyme [Nocardioides sp. YIM 152315]
MTDLTAETVVDTELPEATRRLVRTVDALPDPAYAEPSGLPGWTRAHVVAHLALNAEGLAGALTGVVEGRRVSMYRSQEDRDGDIESLATAAPAVLRSRLLGACTDLADAIDAVPDDEGETVVERVPGGRTFRVGDVPWMRLGEVEIHHADLDAGYTHPQWPDAFVLHVLDSKHLRDPAAGAFSLQPTDLDRAWSAGTGGPTVTGTASELAWWLTGRPAPGLTCEGGALPRIGGM